jgi:ParB-like nuclease family protein
MERKRRLRAIRSNVSEVDLLGIEKKQKRRADRPQALALADINVADKVFQWRNRDENLAQSAHHLKELARVLEATKKPLDPIVVTAVEDRFFLLEGHHRLEAYQAV